MSTDEDLEPFIAKLTKLECDFLLGFKDLIRINQEDGASVIKFIIGPFGSGKTFLQALIQQVAFSEKFVVGKVDFDSNRRLYGSEGKSVATYSEMMKNLSVATSPDGNALPMILDQWDQ